VHVKNKLLMNSFSMPHDSPIVASKSILTKSHVTMIY